MLCAAIDAVFASWNSERAVTYRKHHRIDGLLGTAVNVQMMCPSEVSGVLFTANPVNPALSQIIIESSFGLGEAIVLGKVTPDRFVLDKRSRTTVERTIAHKDRIVATLAEGVPTATLQRDAASLTDDQVYALAELGLRVEEYFGHPCDVEWGLSAGQFYLLQARPIKLQAAAKPVFDPAEVEKVRQEEIAALHTRAEPDGTVWSRFNLSEILPDPTPMTWAIVKRFMSGQGGYGLMYRDLGFDPDPALDEDGIFDLVCGRPYCNLSREPRMQYRSLPFEHPFDVLKKNPHKALYPQAVFNPAKVSVKFLLTVPILFFKMIRSNVRLKGVSRGFVERLRTRGGAAVSRGGRCGGSSGLEQQERSRAARPAGALDTADADRLRRESLKPTALAAVAMGNLERVLTQRLQPAGTAAPTVAGEVPGMKKAQEALRDAGHGRAPAGRMRPGRGHSGACARAGYRSHNSWIASAIAAARRWSWLSPAGRRRMTTWTAWLRRQRRKMQRRKRQARHGSSLPPRRSWLPMQRAADRGGAAHACSAIWDCANRRSTICCAVIR